MECATFHLLLQVLITRRNVAHSVSNCANFTIIFDNWSHEQYISYILDNGFVDRGSLKTNPVKSVCGHPLVCFSYLSPKKCTIARTTSHCSPFHNRCFGLA